MRRSKPEVQIQASRIGSFLPWSESLGEDTDDWKAVDELKTRLKTNIIAGTQIQKDRWPKTYIKKYKIENLYKIDVSGGRRITYTIVADGLIHTANILDCFLTHKEYERFFNY